MELTTEQTNVISIENIIKASYRLNGIVEETPVQRSLTLSDKYEASVFLKREDLQVVRSYKIRGAYNLISQLNDEQRKKGVVCASAGNHAQGFAYSCRLLGIQGEIYMPSTTPSQKIEQVQRLGKGMVKVILTGDTFDAAYAEALAYCKKTGKTQVPPFDHPRIIEGQGTVGVEMLNQVNGSIDYLFVPIGGGGLSAGIGSYFQKMSPNTVIIGVEPQGAPAMKTAIEKGAIETLEKIDTFVDGAAVKRVGEYTYPICRDSLREVCLVPEGMVCSVILQMYNRDAIVLEPAGALSIAAMHFYQEEIKGKNVVCIVSGGNNDIERMPEIKERSLMYEGLKHYFIINFPQRAGALREFLKEVLGPNDDITYFEYTKKTAKTNGPALVGIELKDKNDYPALIKRLKKKGYDFSCLNDDPILLNFLV